VNVALRVEDGLKLCGVRRPPQNRNEPHQIAGGLTLDQLEWTPEVYDLSLLGSFTRWHREFKVGELQPFAS